MKLVRQEQQAGVQVERIVLVGFDQGGAVSLAALLKSKLPFAGVVGMGTYMPLRSEHRNMTKDVRAAEMRTPVLLCHGQYDHHIRCVPHPQKCYVACSCLLLMQLCPSAAGRSMQLQQRSS